MKTPRSPRHRRASPVLAALVIFALVPWSRAAPLARFEALVATAAEDPALGSSFADTALGVLIEANEAELRGVAGRWQQGAREYVARLRALRARLPAAGRLAVLREARGGVRLIVDGEQVMLTAPRIGQQAALEARITDVFCASTTCPSPAAPRATLSRPATPAAAAPAPSFPAAPAEEPRRAGEWSIGDRAPPMYSGADGLHCVFADTRHLRLKQTACASVMGELRRLERALRGVLQQGGLVDWKLLEVRAAVEGQATRVSYGTSGRYFELELPALASAPEVVRSAVPWLQTRLRGQRLDLVIEAPERLAYRVPDTD